MKLTQEEYKKLKEDELISTNIWFLKEYLSELSPIIIIRLFHIVVKKNKTSIIFNHDQMRSYCIFSVNN